MRATDQWAHTLYANITGGLSGPGWMATSPSGGTYDVYATEPGARILSAAAMPQPGATEAQLSPAFGERPSRCRITFLNSSGGGGAYGGALMMQVRRLA